MKTTVVVWTRWLGSWEDEQFGRPCVGDVVMTERGYAEVSETDHECHIDGYCEIQPETWEYAA
ncbi:hypothetical protein [Kutzneria chonburiensis]|uniref:Uncharacterized protein n=1 Tax=Kutzneria chonburiensis TaxID=1483604 RepID=A0ABV6N4Y2_9PSEU|nr:hypothetical protein [Kutzneria chonburiensis]